MSSRRQIRKARKQGAGADRLMQMAPTIGGLSATTSLLMQPPIFPTHVLKKGQLYYEYQLTATSTAGAPAFYVFSANGAFDPNITGTGHQPIGFDQMMSFYDQYCVKAASIKVTFSGLTASVGRVGIMLYDQPSPTSTIEKLVENGLLKMAPLSSANSASFWGTRGVSLHCDIPKYFGASFDELKVNPSFVGTAAANPTEQVYFVIALWGGFSASNMQVSFDVLLSYDIFYYEPKHLDVSFASRRVEEKLAPSEERKDVKPDRPPSAGRKMVRTTWTKV